MIIRSSFLSVVAVALFFSSVFAAPAARASETPGILEAYNAQRDVLRSFQAGAIAEPSQKALNILVESGLVVLEQNGEFEIAARLRTEWMTKYSAFLTTPRPMKSAWPSSRHGLIDDIGDHDPLSPWLANFHDVLSAKAGGVVDAIRIISDVFKLNYALGVVLHPKSKAWKSGEAQEDEWEYRKHFIPMANIVTYWVTLGACNYVAAKTIPEAKKLCGTAATKLEFYMGRYWAPKLSDSVYRKANGLNMNGAPFTDEDFFLSESQFENEVYSAAL